MEDKILVNIKYIDFDKGEIVLNYIEEEEIQLFYQIGDVKKESGHLLSVFSLGQNITSFFKGCSETYYYINRKVVNNTITYTIDEKKPTVEEIEEILNPVVKVNAPESVFKNEEDRYYYEVTESYDFFFSYHQFRQIRYFVGDVCNEDIKHDKEEEYFCRRLIGRRFVPFKIANRDNIIDDVLNK